MIILIDTAEQHPWTFTGIHGDADVAGHVIHVETRREWLGPGWGDYSLDGYRGRVHIERKSTEDAHGTILGWGEHRERFVRELENLSQIECSAVVVECTLGHLVQTAPSHGRKSAAQNGKILFRQVLAWQQDFRVPWIFCDGRRLAEIAAYRILERFWRKSRKTEKEAAKEQMIDQTLTEL